MYMYLAVFKPPTATPSNASKTSNKYMYRILENSREFTTLNFVLKVFKSFSPPPPSAYLPWPGRFRLDAATTNCFSAKHNYSAKPGWPRKQSTRNTLEISLVHPHYPHHIHDFLFYNYYSRTHPLWADFSFDPSVLASICVFSSVSFFFQTF